MNPRLPAFPPKNFDPEKFLINLNESESKELQKVRQVIKPFLRKIPRELRSVSDRVNYLINNP